ncbi:response regulator [Dyadobacter alkalitolerans]|uniref:response regulator n=1 Tax=Dyadobacter alkalitolerans TaxID=492736 RepID=UPI00042035F1|nr:response regulator [Dyadobacter alkalitolerans]
MNILIAEDDPDDQEMIEMAFMQIDPTIVLKIVDNGQKAIDHLKSTSDTDLPCLTILDINMPVLDGLKTLQVLNADGRYRGLAKVILSTSNSTEYKASSMSNGAREFIEKPFSFSELVKVVNRMISYCK